MQQPDKLELWKELKQHSNEIKSLKIIDLLNENPNRVDELSIYNDGIFYDYSKNNINNNTIKLLIALAKAQNIEKFRDDMFAGKYINTSENRAVLHTALRGCRNKEIIINDENISEFIESQKIRIAQLSDEIRNGKWVGSTGKKIKHVINIGIGGSDLGPSMVCNALKSYSERNINIHFVSNIDGTDITETLNLVDPETTLFIIASKSFTTQETLKNADTAKEWIINQLNNNSAVSDHFIAISTNKEAVIDFGISQENILEFRDWVGGRYSLWSTIGLSIAIYIGFDNFKKLLDGAHNMDKHFCEAPLEHNMPVIFAMIGIWNRNFLDHSSYAILPYDQYLNRFTAHMQQVDMESNGKSVDRDGNRVNYPTGPVLFGEPGTNGQHSFYQLIHQGTDIIPCDFLIAKHSTNPTSEGEHHQILQNNFLAQQQAMIKGRSKNEAGGKAEGEFEGNRPCNSIIYDKLTPYNLGQLISLYEHKIFVQGAIWNLNSFDQPGVELGKILADNISNYRNNPNNAHTLDSSTKRMLKYLSE